MKIMKNLFQRPARAYVVSLLVFVPLSVVILWLVRRSFGASDRDWEYYALMGALWAIYIIVTTYLQVRKQQPRDGRRSG
jgi:membrane protein implicated in regulation of membrane protease activity